MSENIYIFIYLFLRKYMANFFLGKKRVFVNNFVKNVKISEKIYIYIFFLKILKSQIQKKIYIYFFYFGKNIYIYIFLRKKYIGKSLIPGLCQRLRTVCF